MRGWQGMRLAVLALAGLVILAGCANREARILFDGNHYPAKSKRVSRQDQQEFVVTVRRVSQGIEGARQAGAHEGTRYCLENFGTSEIDWTIGPQADGADALARNGNLTLRGRCVTW